MNGLVRLPSIAAQLPAAVFQYLIKSKATPSTQRSINSKDWFDFTYLLISLCFILIKYFTPYCYNIFLFPSAKQASLNERKIKVFVFLEWKWSEAAQPTPPFISSMNWRAVRTPSIHWIPFSLLPRFMKEAWCATPLTNHSPLHSINKWIELPLKEWLCSFRSLFIAFIPLLFFSSRLSSLCGALASGP